MAQDEPILCILVSLLPQVPPSLCPPGAPVTPPSSSPTARTPLLKSGWGNSSGRGHHYASLPSSTPPSPGHQIFRDSACFAGIGIPQGRPTFTTFSLASSNPFGFKDEALAGGGYRMWTPGQSGTCLPAIGPGIDQNTDIPLSEVVSDEFAFGINAKGLVKAREGEKIHEERGDDLELTLSSSRTRWGRVDV